MRYKEGDTGKGDGNNKEIKRTMRIQEKKDKNIT
jgi:hypothetical protein